MFAATSSGLAKAKQKSGRIPISGSGYFFRDLENNQSKPGTYRMFGLGENKKFLTCHKIHMSYISGVRIARKPQIRGQKMHIFSI